MRQTRVHLEWSEAPVRRFRTGVSLHSHTLHSHEGLGFIYRLAGRIVPLRWVLERGESQYRARWGFQLDLKRAWWTPPCAPQDAWSLEKDQLERRLQLEALVSLTDHNSIEAPLSLRMLEASRQVPISVEWTVPHGSTFFHLGVHNLPAAIAQQAFPELVQASSSPQSSKVTAVLKNIAGHPGTLIVFNHPSWDESGIGIEKHVELATHFLRRNGEFIHALELNGLRPWAENRQALQMARAFEKPVVSGGDRHALEPNTILDLTNAACFGEYVEQVRRGCTDVLVTSQYREPFGLRVLQSLGEILQDNAEHGRGWQRWTDRVFYRCDDGVVRSLSDLFARRVPGAIQVFSSGVSLIRHHGVLNVCRAFLPRQQEFAL